MKYSEIWEITGTVHKAWRSRYYSTKSLEFYVYGSVHHNLFFWNNQPDAAVCSQFYSTAGLLYMFRAFYTPIIRSTISTVSTASGTNHSIVSASFFQRGLQATGRQHRGCIIPQAVTHSLVLLKMGKIIARNMLSWLELLISRYCCIYLFFYIIYISLYFFRFPKQSQFNPYPENV